jgi:hypothetical protein
MGFGRESGKAAGVVVASCGLLCCAAIALGLLIPGGIGITNSVGKDGRDVTR